MNNFLRKIRNLMKLLLSPRDLAGFVKTRQRVKAHKSQIAQNKSLEIPVARQFADNSYGIFFIAFKDKFVAQAVHCAKSIRKHSAIPVAICCDRVEEQDMHLFDHIEIIKPDHIRAKVDYLSHTPFERTLYIDSDTEVTEDISPVFDILNKYDVAMTHDFARKRQKWSELIPEYNEIPDGFSEFGGGVILYRKSTAKDFMDRWVSNFYKYFDLTNGWDQASLRITSWQTSCSIYVLPPEFNVRSQDVRDKTDTLPAKEGGFHPLRPRILHWHGLDDPNDKTAIHKY